jgi:multiple sugar transport system permease protein
VVTIRDVAKHAGVSPATVSRVVNGLVGYSDETRERVETAVKSLSYETDYLARGLKTRQTSVTDSSPRSHPMLFAAYAISRLNFRFKSVILGVIIATSMFPGISVVVPLLRLFTDIGWINTYQAMIVPNLSFAIPLAVWNLTTFMKALPFDLEEAAMIDGCTKWQAFRRVLLPLAAPGVFTTAILTFIHSWNEFIIALSMINDPKVQTATVAISKFTGATEFQAPFGEQMAAGVIVTVPLVIMVLIFQRRIVEGLTAGASK